MALRLPRESDVAPHEPLDDLLDAGGRERAPAAVGLEVGDRPQVALGALGRLQEEQLLVVERL